jgi:hypothetical protein
MPLTAKEPTLPNPDSIELTNYKIASFLSDLDSIQSALEGCYGVTVDDEGAFRRALQDFEYRRAEGIAEPESKVYDPAELERLVVFAVNVLDDLPSLKEHAEAIRRLAITLFNEAEEAGADYWARVRAWHEAELRGGREED